MDLTSYLMGRKASGGGGGGGLDWTALGFESTPEAIVIGYNTAKDIKDNWVVKSSYANEYESNKDIIIFPVVDLSSATNVTEMFSSCSCLFAVGDMNCSNATSFNRLFGNCSALKSIGVIDCSGVSNSSGAYYMFNNVYYLEYIGGLKDLGKSFNNSWSINSFTLDLSPCNKLTHDSLMNVINSVYDLKTKGAKNQKIKVGSTNLAKLSAEEIQAAADKGWNVVAS